MTDYRPIPLPGYVEYSPEEMLRRAALFQAEIARRHTVRQFAGRPVVRALIEHCLLAAGTAPVPIFV